MLRPRRVYKYKSVNNKTDLKRIIKILTKHQIYVPTIKELNDPLEAMAVYVRLAVAGSGYIAEMGEVHPIVQRFIDEFRALSFSALPSSPLMWAHYAANHSGCCIAFETFHSFSDIQPVIYSDVHMVEEEPSLPEIDPIKSVVKDSLNFKLKDWSYENEWRLILNQQQKVLSFDPEELAGIIVGYNIKKEYKEKLIEVCSAQKIPILETKINACNATIRFVVPGYDLEGYTLLEIDKWVEESDLSIDQKNFYMAMNQIYEI